MKDIYFASQNLHKIKEINAILPSGYRIISAYDLGIEGEIPETGSTLVENALQKACFLHRQFGIDCFADDTGLEVDSLNGEPGVFSARYAGEEKNADKNMDKLLMNLEGKSNRAAQFKTVIAMIKDGKEYVFEGLLKGSIGQQKVGTNGFGYDPIFIPLNHSRTLAELSPEEKNKISHRGEAVKKLIEFLGKTH